MIKLLVVDQHPIVCKGLELIFNATPEIKFVGSVNNGGAIVKFLKSTPVDVILTEIDLPKLNGLTAIRQIKTSFPTTKILMYTAQSEDVYAVCSIRAGADGFISKSATIETLKAAIVKVSNDGVYLSKALLLKLDKNYKDLEGNNFYKKLSIREVEVLKLLASGKRNKDIAKELNISQKTVSTYRARVMKKLHADNLIDLVDRFKTMPL